MAAERKTQSKNRGITRQQIWKIWETITPRDWCDLFSRYKKESKLEFSGETTLKGLCPHPQHSDTSPSFFIFTGKGYAKCFGCDYYTSNPIELLALVMNATPADAVQYLNERYTLGFLSKRAVTELKAQRTNQNTKQAIMKACNQVMCLAVSEPEKHLYAKQAIDWLTKTRRIPTDVLHALPVGIVPPLVELTTLIEHDYQKVFTEWENATDDRDPVPPENVTENVIDYMSVAYDNSYVNGGVIFPLHVTPAEIGRLKIREPVAGLKKNFVIPADEFEDLLGLYGLGWKPYSPLIDPKKPDEWVYLTEGEMDVLTYMAQTLKRGKPNIPLLSVGGRGGSAHIEPILKASGFTSAYMIGDSPNKGASGGDVVVQYWMEKIRNTRIKVFTGWDAFIPAGDIDEAILQHGINKVEDTLYKEPDRYFTPVWQWAADNACLVIDNLSDKDYRVVIEVATSYGSCLRHKHDIECYTNELANRYTEITAPILKREITSSEDTEAGFILRCTDALQDLFTVIATHAEGGQRYLILYDKKSREYRRIRLDSDQSIAQELAPSTGNLLQFVREEIGFPAFLEDPDDLEGQGRRRIDLITRYYLKEACLNLAQGVPDLHSHTLYRQGYHAIEPKLGEKKQEYIVCGKDIFLLERPSDTKTNFIKLEGPRHGDTLFDIGLTNTCQDIQSWYPDKLTVDVLNESKTTDLKEMYKDLVTFFSKGFIFKSHDITCEFLAAQTMIFPIMNIFERQMLLSITGESNSGKSSLMSVFIGVFYPELQLINCSQGSDSYSYASVSQETDGCSKLLGLDEYEYDGPKSEIVKSINELFRGLVTGRSKRTMGQKDGRGSRALNFKLSMVTSGITAAERPQDLNRLVIVETKKREGRDAVQSVLFRELGRDKIAELRKNLTFSMFHHIPEIVKRHKTIMESFVELNSKVSFPVEWRYASALFPVMALLNYIGLDEKKFYYDFINANETTIHCASSVNESTSLLNTMFNYGILYQPDTKRKISVGALLNQTSTRGDVNTHSCGVYFDEQTRYVMILLAQAIPVLIPPKNVMCNAPEIRIKSVLERHKFAIPVKTVRDSGIISRAATYMGSNISTDDVVVFAADAWLNDSKDESETPPKPKPSQSSPTTTEPKVSVNSGGSTESTESSEILVTEEDYNDWGD